MARNRTPQTQEKRRREYDKQRKRQEKIAKRHERNVAKREAKKTGVAPPSVSVLDANGDVVASSPATPDKQ
jgi:hypothetical protein